MTSEEFLHLQNNGRVWRTIAVKLRNNQELSDEESELLDYYAMYWVEEAG